MALFHYQFAVVFVVIGFSIGTLSELKKRSMEAMGECNFDDQSFCGWKQPKTTDNFDWTLNRGITLSHGTGPSGDRTGKGYYAYIESSSPRRKGDKARLQSGPYSGVYCLHFSYSMIGNSIASLSVLHVIGKGSAEVDIWSKKGQQLPNTWKSDNVTVYGINYYIVFEATVGDSYTGDIAIDDIYLTNGSCYGESIVHENITEEGKCSFDHGVCDWTNDLVATEYPWYLSSYRRRQSARLSRRDHGGKLGGQFLYAVKGRNHATKSRLVSRPLCGPKCVEFFYVMERTTNSELRMFVRDEDEEDRLWFVNGKSAQTKDWKRGLAEVVRGDASKCYQLIFEADLSGRQSPLIGLDDILIANGSCCPLISSPEKAAKANCSFDDDTFCKWQHPSTTNFFWSIGDGETPSGKLSGGLTGPSADYSGIGKYAYIEASEPHYVGDTAVLVSGMMAGMQCMTFKYHMYGDDIGTLSVYRRDVLLWKEEGNHGNQWIETSVDFDCSIPKYQIKIEATVGGWKGDIAIDELHVTPGACPVKGYRNVIGTTPSPPTLPTLAPLPPPTGKCNFLLDFCDWSNTYTDDGDWIRHKSETPSYHTGPHFDRDGDGYYIYLEATDLLPGQQIRLESREISGPICLTFYYHMFGKDIGELKIEQRNLTDNSTSVAWLRSGEEEDFWDFGLQAFYGERYKVTFVGVRGKGFLGDIALDEIGIVEEGECHSHGTFVLGSDGRSNPALANCDFEDDIVPMCMWANDGFDEFNWLLSKKDNWRGTPSGGTGASHDHTIGHVKAGQKKGRFIYIEASSPRRLNDQAYLLVKVEGRALCMKFWYHMYGEKGMGTLEVVRVTREHREDEHPARKEFQQTKPLLKLEKDRGNYWHQAVVYLPFEMNKQRTTVNWIALVATIGSSYQGDIGVDDIQFTQGRCAKERN